ncbi:unnamed protein product [Rotaria sp. Silwood1]|nr:unnamed protein product [Rotaria sp. Silwood1]CAF3451793.1 unnamed protein product [Rotaria sp. Silwood1]
MDSDSDETLSDENESSISFDELESSGSEDNVSLIEELNQSSMDDWEWKVDNSSFSTSFNYFDGHALGNNIIRPIDSFFKFLSQDLIKLITNQTNIYGKQRCVQKGEDATSWKEVDENLIHAFLATGTIRSDRKHFPTELKKGEKLERGDYRYLTSNGVSVIKWMDKKEVLIASNYFDRAVEGEVSRRDKDGTCRW